MTQANAPTGKDLSRERVLPAHRDLYYGGAWHAPRAGRYVDTIDPAQDAPLAAVAEADAADVDAAVRAAQAAFPAWRALRPAQRAQAMREAAAVLRDHAEELAMLDALNTGNPVAEMITDARVAAHAHEYFAGLAQEAKGTTIPMGPGLFNYTLREPLGVVARIVAYNHPLMFAAAKIAAPLAAGNTVVVKAAAQAPLSALRMAELIGGLFPPGVLNVVAGDRACGEALSTHPLVRKVTLIGSVPTGKAIMRAAADTLKPVLLELGGKNALIAFPDADVEAVADGVVRGMNFTWAGQSCGSTSRAFLHASLHDAVLDRVVTLIAQRHRPGPPTDFATTMGPLGSRAQYEKVLRYIGHAQEDGARLVTGGKRPDDPRLARGFFVEPTVFADVTPAMRIAREEIFGPVLSVLRWDDEAAMLRDVNAVDYGLTAAIFTRDLATAHRVAAQVEAGYVWVNQAGPHFPGAPFGGVKHSGIGREESLEELLEFTQVKNVNVKL
ncbi:MAG: aldehyde dehydrogenase family protein [Burkholderiales bacterium]